MKLQPVIKKASCGHQHHDKALPRSRPLASRCVAGCNIAYYRSHARFVLEPRSLIMTSLRGIHRALHTQSRCQHVLHLCKPFLFGWTGPSWHCVPEDRPQSTVCSCDSQLAGISATLAIEDATLDEGVTDQEGLQRREIERLLGVLPADLQLAIVSTGNLWQVCEFMYI